MSYLKISNKIIEWGIIFLIAFTPIAFGAVHPWAYTFMELTICFLIIIWIIRLAKINLKKRATTCQNLNPPGKLGRTGRRGKYRESRIQHPVSSIENPASSIQHRESSIQHPPSIINRLGFIKTPLNIPIIIFIGLILFQLVPLPPGVLKFISPNTYQLYKTTTPGWPDGGNESTIQHQESSIEHRVSSIQHPVSRIENPVSSIKNQESRIEHPESRIKNQESSNEYRTSTLSSPSWRSISIYKHATKIELYKILAYIGIFFLIVNYNPSTRSRGPVTTEHRIKIKRFITRLIIALIVIGSFESIYGLLECMSGHGHVLFRTVDGRFVTGTYINRNHFSWYMALVICTGFGYLTYISSGFIKTNVSGWRQRLSRIINQVGTKTGLLFFIILIMSSSLILSGSRMGICSFITSVILMSLIKSKKMSLRKISIVLIPVCLIALWIGLNPVFKRFSQITNTMGVEGSRSHIWKDTSNLIKEFPVLGTGLGTYEYAFPKYKTIKRQRLYDHAHNDYLELISNTGFAGFVIIIAGGAYYLIMVTRLFIRRRDPFVRGITIGCLGGMSYIILHSLTDFNLQIPANALHLSMITGIMHKTITQL
ncbi:MAG: O-antigen ligase family protein [Candidatus Brocadiaceae bacterium]|nr:O-antigen ligase family protein [Candidatus Brocadiaceae bacterium]